MRAFVASCAVAMAGVLVGCTEREAPQVSDEYSLWQASLATRLSDNVLRLRNGDCLDTSRLSPPWSEDHDESVFQISASGDEVGIEPYEVERRTTSFGGIPYDGRVRVGISGWDSSNTKFVGGFIQPGTIERNVTSGWFKPLKLWREADHMYAFQSTTERYYVDERRLTQCRDYSDPIGLIWCHGVSADEQYRYSVKLAASEQAKIPQTLSRIERAIEAMRGNCPAPALAPQGEKQ